MNRRFGQPDLPPEPPRSVASLWRVLSRIFSYARPYWLRLAVGLLLTGMASLVWLAIPLGLRSLLDSVFEARDQGMLDLLGLGMLVLFVLQSVLSFGSHYLVSWVGERTVTDLRKQVYAHLNLLSLRFFTDRKLGELTSRLTNDVGAVRNAVAESMAQLLTQVFMLLGSVCLMVALNWRLTLIRRKN